MISRVRIIGGKWRGRKLEVGAVNGLRPTPDRIRETLFNWLAPDCPGAVVLDCFAGSGALGFEALSRGARRLLALEQNPDARAQLRRQARLLGEAGTEIEIGGGNALDVLARCDQRFDLVFIDPPYARPELRARCVELLEARGCLRDGALLYFEWPRGERFELPSPRLGWRRQKIAGRVNYAIAEWRRTG